MICDGEIWRISGQLQKQKVNWKDLGQWLRLHEDEVSSIRKRSKSSLERTYLLLRKWNSVGDRTIGAFLNVLTEQGKRKAAEFIFEYMWKVKRSEVKRRI